MWQGTEVKTYLEKSPTVNTKSLILAEWNLNYPDNVTTIGNYRYRPTISSPITENYGIIAPTWDPNDALEAYTGATDSDVVVDGGYGDLNVPVTFISQKEKNKRLFSLEACLEKFRPRSGINKFVYFPGRYLNKSNPKMAQQPRYYMPSIEDKFKYWTSYRTEGIQETLTATITAIATSAEPTDTEFVTYNPITKISAVNGFETGDRVVISGVTPSRYNGTYLIVSASSTSFKIDADFGTSDYSSGGIATVTKTTEKSRGIAKGSNKDIEDAAPFVVYESTVPANRIVVKIQTNVGDVDLGPYINDKTGATFNDPFFGDTNKTTPKSWKIQYLDNNNEWQNAKTFTNGIGTSSYEFPSDGYVELAYGVTNIPTAYADNFVLVGEVSSASSIPSTAPNGYAWLITDGTDAGTYRIFNDTITPLGYEDVSITYGWYVNQQIPTRTSNYAKELTNPKKFGTVGNYSYREFQYIKGLRIVVDTMNKKNSTFDLIEMSPRLAVDLSDRTKSFNITKHASDLGESGLPVGQILSSTGEISLFDFDQAFNPNNTNSIVANLSTKNLQIKFYEQIIDNTEFTYFIPLKTLYADGFPETDLKERNMTIQLKDQFSFIESLTAPQLLVPDCSLSVAVSILLDSIGFSNYVFKRIGDKEPIIPYFFVAPETSVSQVLQDLAVSTQTAMFFDEYNNLILMTKEYMMPTDVNDRATDLTLIGSETYVSKPSVYSNLIDNQDTGLDYAPLLSNIASISEQKDDVFNDGKIVYKTRYIQRETPSFSQALALDSQKTWVYKPVLLWEVSPEQTTKSWNDEVSTQSAYSLAAIPLATSLSNSLPEVVDGEVVNNIMDLGEAVYWLSRYNGYFYANGEIIKFDAVEYNIATKTNPGNYWITDVQEYQKYFANLAFGGKIYPTGRVRIYSEPYYDEAATNGLKSGPVAKHGRGQFGTKVTSHTAGLSGDSESWTNPNNIKTCYMTSSLLFNGGTVPQTIKLDSSTVKAGSISSNIVDGVTIPKANANGIIKNFLSNTFNKETEIASSDIPIKGTIQSSALVFSGPTYPANFTPSDFVSYIPKQLDENYVSFGTRMRIIGSIENSDIKTQTPNGSMTYYSVQKSNSTNSNVGGASGGLSFWLDTETNYGYYFEIAALTDNNINSYTTSTVNNVFFYKVRADKTGKGIPILLWSGFTNILVDDGNFTGQNRVAAEENPTVYDLGVEYDQKGLSNKGYRFYLSINGKLIATVVDKDPMAKKTSMALFVRGSSKVMFENIYALTTNYAQNNSALTKAPVSSVFSANNMSRTNSFVKYGMPGAIQSTFLSGIKAKQDPDYLIYYEEFGTIMREMSYFNIRYEKAYPALFAKLAPTFNNLQAYAVSGFAANAYGAEFLIFNISDSVVNLDDTSGNYLRILGITFTQESEHTLSVDEYFQKNSNLADPQIGSNNKTVNINTGKQYLDIKQSRMVYGRKEFVLDTPYIQTQDDANTLMEWLTDKIMQPRKSVGVNIFSLPILQLGDIVEIDYSKDGVDQVSDSRFVVYSIDYTRNETGPEMTIYLSEVK